MECRHRAELVRTERHSAPLGSLDSGAARWVLTDVIGLEDGLGVECLSGSGAIASAYNRVFRYAFFVVSHYIDLQPSVQVRFFCGGRVIGLPWDDFIWDENASVGWGDCVGLPTACSRVCIFCFGYGGRVWSKLMACPQSHNVVFKYVGTMLKFDTVVI